MPSALPIRVIPQAHGSNVAKSGAMELRSGTDPRKTRDAAKKKATGNFFATLHGYRLTASSRGGVDEVIV